MVDCKQKPVSGTLKYAVEYPACTRTEKDLAERSLPGQQNRARREKEKSKQKQAAAAATAKKGNPSLRPAESQHLTRQTPFICNIRFRNDLPEVGVLQLPCWALVNISMSLIVQREAYLS